MTISYGSRLLPGGAFLDPNTGRFEWTPAYFQEGLYEIPMTVSDGQLETTQIVNIDVLNVNAAPVFSTLGNWVVQEGQVLYFRAFAYDPDNPGFEPQFRLADGSLTPLEGSEASVTYEVSNLPPGAEFDVETAFFQWVPPYDAAGDYTLTITATDDGDGTGTPLFTSQDVPITVLNGNRPPEITPIDNVTLGRGEVLDVPITVSDPDGNPVTLSLRNALQGYPLPEFISFTDGGDGTGTVRIEPGDGHRGDHTVTLIATDNGDGGPEQDILSSQYSFVITVDYFNERPILEHIGDKVAIVGQPLTFTVRASDPDQHPLMFFANGSPAGATLTAGTTYGTAIFEWTPTAADLRDDSDHGGSDRHRQRARERSPD